jgi:ABC-type multidrug transport system ATPase subunit
MTPTLPLLELNHVDVGPAGGPVVLAGLSARVVPGLMLILGGDGAGKTTLLRLLAGELAPRAGEVRRSVAAEAVFWCDPLSDRHDARSGEAYLAWQRGRHAGWQDEALAHHVERFGLAEHLGKPLYALSAGTRRKLRLAAALASGAPLTLIDDPFAALDRRAVLHLLDAIEDVVAPEDGRPPTRALVVAHAGSAEDFDGIAPAAVLALPARDD